MDQLASPAFWAALGNIILVNVVLSGDNAVVIAMAARALPPMQQRRAIFFGSGAAIVLRIVLTIFALEMLTLPYLKVVGAVLLFYIGAQLLAEEEEEEAGVPVHTTLASAIRTILLADLVMSLDNVLGVAAASKGNVALLVAGLAISIPLIVFGSTLVLKLMERVPFIIVLGAALLGYLSGEMLFSDTAVAPWIDANLPRHDIDLPALDTHLSGPGILGAIGVVLVGHWIARRKDDGGTA
ncbi:TerC family protein [Oxalobacteraceae bacterium OM1]|nr:TerC family protein [Oxalobacteraceae bacterium OM1]